MLWFFIHFATICDVGCLEGWSGDCTDNQTAGIFGAAMILLILFLSFIFLTAMLKHIVKQFFTFVDVILDSLKDSLLLL